MAGRWGRQYPYIASMTGDNAETRTVRPAGEADAERCAEIYGPYVRESAITFELDPPDAVQMAARIKAASRGHAWLLIEQDGVIAGYAYAGPMHARAAYRWSCEVSVYVDRDRRGEGLGRALYEALLPALADRGYHTAVAGMTLPNPASERLHRSLGFQPVGVYRRIGYKLGAWHDVAWLQLALAGGPDPPPEPS